MRRTPAPAIAALVLGLVLLDRLEASPWNLQAGAGPDFPAGGAFLHEAVGTGFIGSLALGYALTPSLQLVGRLACSELPRDDAGALLVAAIDKHPARILEISGGTLSAWDVLGELRYVLPPSTAAVHPYVLAGAGVTTYRYERVDIAYAYAGHTWPATIPGEAATVACLVTGGGLRLEVSKRLALALDARLHVTLRVDGALWSVPLCFEVAVSL